MRWPMRACRRAARHDQAFNPYPHQAGNNDIGEIAEPEANMFRIKLVALHSDYDSLEVAG
jgi:hypothetical protein